MQRTLMATVAALACVGIAACGGSGDDTPVDSGERGNVIVLTASDKLLTFNADEPGSVVSSTALKGLEAGETLVGIDVRPADGQIYAVSDQGNIYTLDLADGDATLAATLQPAAGDDNPYTELTGTSFGVDFNPVADRLRVVSDTGLNLRINVETGDTITDGDINGEAAGSAVVASAYTNSFAGTTTTQLYNLAAGADVLYLQNPPNDGTQAMPVPLGVTVTDFGAFDIDARSNMGYAVLGNMLYGIDLAATEAAATAMGTFGGGETVKGMALMQPEAPMALALTTTGELLAFDPAMPNTIEDSVTITGLANGETLLGIDFRPADGLLYGMSSTGRVLTLDTDTGAATAVSTLAADPTDTTDPYTGLMGTNFSVDFNPVADRLRVISDSGQSLRINVETGVTITDGMINRATPASVVAAAYGSNFAGTLATTLFDLDAASDVLARQVPPNDGTLVDVGPLGIDVEGPAAMDIAGGDNGLVLAALRPVGSGPYTLYTVSLTTGAATLYRNEGEAAMSFIGGANGPAVRDIAIRY
jgi:hypothetical protein